MCPRAPKATRPLESHIPILAPRDVSWCVRGGCVKFDLGCYDMTWHLPFRGRESRHALKNRNNWTGFPRVGTDDPGDPLRLQLRHGLHLHPGPMLWIPVLCVPCSTELGRPGIISAENIEERAPVCTIFNLGLSLGYHSSRQPPPIH